MTRVDFAVALRQLYSCIHYTIALTSRSSRRSGAMSERRRKPGPGGRGGGLRDDGAVRGGRESSSHSPLIKSPYFSTTKVRRRPRSAAAAAAWIPPRSPFRLIQEDLFYDPWKVLLAAIFLNKTRACQAVPNLLRFLERWPDAPSVLDSTESLISEHLRPLGLHHLRARLILQFTGTGETASPFLPISYYRGTVV